MLSVNLFEYNNDLWRTCATWTAGGCLGARRVAFGGGLGNRQGRGGRLRRGEPWDHQWCVP